MKIVGEMKKNLFLKRLKAIHPRHSFDSYQAERGSASVEFVGLSVVLLIPLIYLVIFLSLVQSATFAADSAARQVSRVYSVQPDEALRNELTAAILQNTANDYGVAINSNSLSISCSTPTCPTAGAFLTVEVKIGVNLPGIGPIGIGQNLVEVSATHSLVVDDAYGVIK